MNELLVFLTTPSQDWWLRIHGALGVIGAACFWGWIMGLVMNQLWPAREADQEPDSSG